MLLSEKFSVRYELRPGDIGIIIHLHGIVYNKEYGYGTGFESYVAKGMAEFHESFDAIRDRIWIIEENKMMCGFLLLQHRSDISAQLRYFILTPECRNKGLGKWLMQQFMTSLKDLNYQHCYLWTTSELVAAAKLYSLSGFKLTEEKPSSFFGKPVLEQRYDWRWQGITDVIYEDQRI